MSARTTTACLAAVAAALVALATAEPRTAAARRVVLISFDAGADWIVDRLIEEAKAPAFAAIARDGARADAMVSVMPSLTAVAHASFWTGAFPRAHGATDNTMPRTPLSAHTLLERQSGYLSTVLKAEPIWDAAARQGKRVLVMQASQGFPFTNTYPSRIRQFDIYANELLRSALVTGTVDDDGLAFSIGETPAHFAGGATGGTLSLTVGSQTTTLSPGAAGFSPPMRVTVEGVDGHVRIGALEYDAATRTLLALRGDVVRLAATDQAEGTALMKEAGVTVGEVGGGHYSSGGFGPTLAAGGDGAAERHLVEVTVANQQYFDGALRYAARQPWDLLVLYVPSMDAVGHALGGMLDPDTPGHDPQLAAKVWPVYEEVFRRCMDGYVTELRRLLPDATLVIGSDHGVEGMRRWFYPNAVLREAGLLAEAADGTVDLARTKALFLYSHGGGVHVNSAEHKGGIVPIEERDAVKARARDALLAARDPESGTPLVRAVIDTARDGETAGIGGDVAADLYPDPTPGYYISGRFGSKVVVGPPVPPGMGAHGAPPTRRRLHAIFYAVGPGVRAGGRPETVRQVDVAPTVASLLGLDPPAQSIGTSLAIE